MVHRTNTEMSVRASLDVPPSTSNGVYETVPSEEPVRGKRQHRERSRDVSNPCNCLCFVCADDSVRVIFQWMGAADPITKGDGLHLIWWPFQTAALVSLKVRQIDVETATKTRDNVQITVCTAIQFKVEEDKVSEFKFRLNNPNRQLESYVHDSIRSHLPTMSLDDAFQSKSEIASAVSESVEHDLGQYGIQIVAVLVTKLVLPKVVDRAMNEVNAALRQKVAATDRAEAEKLAIVKEAEGDAEALRLLGIGLANQRMAICEGFAGSVSMSEDAREDIYTMLTMQYMDVADSFAKNSVSSLIIPSAGGKQAIKKSTEMRLRGGGGPEKRDVRRGAFRPSGMAKKSPPPPARTTPVDAKTIPLVPNFSATFDSSKSTGRETPGAAARPAGFMSVAAATRRDPPPRPPRSGLPHLIERGTIQAAGEEAGEGEGEEEPLLLEGDKGYAESDDSRTEFGEEAGKGEMCQDEMKAPLLGSGGRSTKGAATGLWGLMTGGSSREARNEGKTPADIKLDFLFDKEGSEWTSNGEGGRDSRDSSFMRRESAECQGKQDDLFDPEVPPEESIEQRIIGGNSGE